jgi:hypothetical protein
MEVLQSRAGTSSQRHFRAIPQRTLKSDLAGVGWNFVLLARHSDNLGDSSPSFFDVTKQSPHGCDRTRAHRWLLPERRLPSEQDIIHSAKVESLASRAGGVRIEHWRDQHGRESRPGTQTRDGRRSDRGRSRPIRSRRRGSDPARFSGTTWRAASRPPADCLRRRIAAIYSSYSSPCTR